MLYCYVVLHCIANMLYHWLSGYRSNSYFGKCNLSLSQIHHFENTKPNITFVIVLRGVSEVKNDCSL